MFDDCARPTIGVGPPLVPNVMTRVPVLGGNVPPLFCAPVSPASATMLMLINVVNRKDDGFCIFLTLGRHRLIDGSWDQEEGYAPAVAGRPAPLRSAGRPGRRPPPHAEIHAAQFSS